MSTQKKVVDPKVVEGVTATIRCVTSSSTCPCVDLRKCVSVCNEDGEFIPVGSGSSDPEGSCVEPPLVSPKIGTCREAVSVCRLLSDDVDAEYCVTVSKIAERHEFYNAVVVLGGSGTVNSLTYKVQSGTVPNIAENDCATIAIWTDVFGSETTLSNLGVTVPANISINGSFVIPDGFECGEGDYFRLVIISPVISPTPVSECFQCGPPCTPLKFCLKDPNSGVDDQEITEAQLDAEGGSKTFTYKRTFESDVCEPQSYPNTATLYEIGANQDCDDVDDQTHVVGEASALVTINCTVPTIIGSAVRNCETHDTYCVCKSSEIKPPAVDLGCVWSQGHWKNSGGCGQDNGGPWPDLNGVANIWGCDLLVNPGDPQFKGLLLGTGPHCYSPDELCEILQQNPSGPPANGLVQLAHQLIAAKFNQMSGAAVPPAVAVAIAQADTLIDSLVIPPVGSGFLLPAVTDPIKDILEAYNLGTNFPNTPGYPPHCGDEPAPSVCDGTLIVYNVDVTRTRTRKCTVEVEVTVCVECLSYKKTFEVSLTDGLHTEYASQLVTLGPVSEGSKECKTLHFSLGDVPDGAVSLGATLRWYKQKYNLSLCTLEDVLDNGDNPIPEHLPIVNIDIIPGNDTVTSAVLTDKITVKCVQSEECEDCSYKLLIPEISDQNPPQFPLANTDTDECNAFVLENTVVNGIFDTRGVVNAIYQLLVDPGYLTFDPEHDLMVNDELHLSFVVSVDDCVCSITNTATVEYNDSGNSGIASKSITDVLKDCGDAPTLKVAKSKAVKAKVAAKGKEVNAKVERMIAKGKNVDAKVVAKSAAKGKNVDAKVVAKSATKAPVAPVVAKVASAPAVSAKAPTREPTKELTSPNILPAETPVETKAKCSSCAAARKKREEAAKARAEEAKK